MSDSSDDMEFYSGFCDDSDECDDYENLLAHRDQLLIERDELVQRCEELEIHNNDHGCGIAKVSRERDELKAMVEQLQSEVVRLDHAHGCYFELSERQKKEIARMRASIERIANVASKYDKGERQYTMSDWEYVLKQCERELMMHEALGAKGDGE